MGSHGCRARGSVSRRPTSDSGSALAVTLAVVALTTTITAALVERAHMTLRDIDARRGVMRQRDILDGALRAALALGDCVTTTWAMDASMSPVVVSCGTLEVQPARIEAYVASSDAGATLAAVARRDTDGGVVAWSYAAD